MAVSARDFSHMDMLLKGIKDCDSSRRAKELKSLAKLLSDHSSMREVFYKLKGVPRILELFWSKDKFTVYYTLYVLAYSAFNHVGNQLALSTDHVFKILYHLLKQSNSKHHTLKSTTRVIYLICCIVQGNSKGQLLVRNSKCLKRLALMFPYMCQVVLNHTRDEFQSVAMCWEIFCTSITMSIGNPHISENQMETTPIIPEATLLLSNWIQNVNTQFHLSKFIDDLVSMLPHILMNNTSNQYHFTESSGIYTIVRGLFVLEKWLNSACDLTMILYKFVQLLNITMIDNIENCKLIGSLHTIPLLLRLLLKFDNKLKISPLAALANLIENCKYNRTEFTKENGFNIITLVTKDFEEDSEAKALISYMCKHFSQCNGCLPRQIETPIHSHFNGLNYPKQSNNNINEHDEQTRQNETSVNSISKGRDNQGPYSNQVNCNVNKHNGHSKQTEILINSISEDEDRQHSCLKQSEYNLNKQNGYPKQTKILINSFYDGTDCTCTCQKQSSDKVNEHNRQTRQTEILINSISNVRDGQHFYPKPMNDSIEENDERAGSRDESHLTDFNIQVIPACSTPMKTNNSLSSSSSKQGEYLNFVVPLLPPRKPGETYSLYFSNKPKEKLGSKSANRQESGMLPPPKPDELKFNRLKQNYKILDMTHTSLDTYSLISAPHINKTNRSTTSSFEMRPLFEPPNSRIQSSKQTSLKTGSNTDQSSWCEEKEHHKISTLGEEGSRESINFSKRSKDKFTNHYRLKHTKWIADSDTESSIDDDQNIDAQNSIVTKIPIQHTFTPKHMHQASKGKTVAFTTSDELSDSNTCTPTYPELCCSRRPDIVGTSKKCSDRESVTRKRAWPSSMVHYSEEETRNLAAGVKKFGHNFTAIRRAYRFHEKRTAKDLYLKWRSSFLNDKGKEMFKINLLRSHTTLPHGGGQEELREGCEAEKARHCV